MTGHGFAVDWWTFGVLIYEMITGRPPFMNQNHHKLGILIRQGQVVFPDAIRHKIPMSEQSKDLISKLLDKNPESRLGSKLDKDGKCLDADEICSHPWFEGIDWLALCDKKLKMPFTPDQEQLKKSRP